MKQRFLSLLLAALLALGTLLPALPAARAAAGEEDPDGHLVAALKDFFAGAEGDYGAVNADDGGACSLGLLQWHGARALALLRYALEGWPGCANYLTQSLYDEIADPAADWGRRVLTAEEAAHISALLGSSGGRAAQDALARRDILSYVALCRDWGMASDATAAYFAVIVNQFGAGGAAAYLRHIRATLGLAEGAAFSDLTVLHRAVHNTASYGQRYLAMRDKSYAYIASLGWALTAPTLGPRPAPEAAGQLAARAKRGPALGLEEAALALLRCWRRLFS